MARPKKCRHIDRVPKVTIFKPSEISLQEVEPVIVAYEELEAVRLADFQAKKQTEAAAIMNISRATFGRIIEKARFKIADALLNGKAIVISGGDFCNIDLHVRSDSDIEEEIDELNRQFMEIREKCLTCPKYKARKDNIVESS
jgi:uncharacterized protein